MTLTNAMRLLYSYEINFGISCFWDGGWDVILGDEINGIKASANFAELQDVGDWLIEQAREHYPACIFVETDQ